MQSPLKVGFHALRFFEMFLTEMATAQIFKLLYATALLREKQQESQLLNIFILIKTYPNTLLNGKT